MKKSILILLFFLSHFANCQELNRVKKLDTLFVVFKGTEFETKKEFKKIDEITIKYFKFNLEKDNSEIVKFMFPRLINNDSVRKKIGEFTFVDKSYINSHQTKIVTIDFLKNIKDCLSILNIFNNNLKTIYFILDFTEEKNGKIPMYPVSPLKYCYIKMD
jgi:hypothetical protein